MYTQVSYALEKIIRCLLKNYVQSFLIRPHVISKKLSPKPGHLQGMHLILLDFQQKEPQVCLFILFPINLEAEFILSHIDL